MPFKGAISFATRQTLRTLDDGHPFLAAESLLQATEAILGALDGEAGCTAALITDGRQSLNLTIDGDQVRIHGAEDSWARPLCARSRDFVDASLRTTRALAEAILERHPAHRQNRRLTDLLAERIVSQQYAGQDRSTGT